MPQDIDFCQYIWVSNSLTVLSPAETAACCAPLTAQPLTMEQADLELRFALGLGPIDVVGEK